jgi:hypothetical protein
MGRRNAISTPAQSPVRCVKFFETLRILTIILLFISLSSVGQTLPDSVVIIKKTYVNDFSGNDNIYRTDNYSIILDDNRYSLNGDRITKSKILNLLTELTKASNADNSLVKYKLDTNWIKSNPVKLLKLYTDKERYEWNEQQKEFIFKKLTDLSIYKEELSDFLLSGRSYTMHNSYKNEFIIKFYKKGTISNEIKSRKYVWGYKMPWTNQLGDTLYNFSIETKLKDILSTKEKLKVPLKGYKLQKYLVNKIIDYYMSSLYELSAYSYQKEIDELKTDFTILGASEVYLSGGYMKEGQSAIKITLKNNLMFDNVSTIYFATKQNKSIYSRDSLKRDYKKYIDRIQTIPFITDYLRSNPKTKLDIYYFNNKGIDDANIDNINKNPKQWKQHDDYLKSLETSQKLGVIFSFDLGQAIKTSQQVYCGCNYRYDKSFLEKAILFKIVDENGNSTSWLLLPDNRVLLYLMQGDRVLNFSYQDFGNSRGLQYPCKLFDYNGKTIPK